jgi:dTDP-4-amino-4,6-dideoxygalactose transaminase
LHLQPPYAAYGTGDYAVTESLSQRGLSLPSANNLTAGDIERVGQAIRELAGRGR